MFWKVFCFHFGKTNNKKRSALLKVIPLTSDRKSKIIGRLMNIVTPPRHFIYVDRISFPVKVRLAMFTTLDG